MLSSKYLSKFFVRDTGNNHWYTFYGARPSQRSEERWQKFMQQNMSHSTYVERLTSRTNSLLRTIRITVLMI